jgi:hypothetical protein
MVKDGRPNRPGDIEMPECGCQHEVILKEVNGDCVWQEILCFYTTEVVNPWSDIVPICILPSFIKLHPGKDVLRPNLFVSQYI